jgi:hypothetical protein
MIAAIFVFFPLLYMLSGYSHEIWRAILHSLETSTFLEGSKEAGTAAKDTVPIAAKFVAGFERIAVPVQAGMFALAVQRKFARK